MKKISLLLITIALTTAITFGQSDRGKEKIEAARIAMITKELNLTPEQAQRFWPLYNEFKDKRTSIAREFNQERKAFDAANASEEERKNMVTKGLDLKQRQLNLEKEYAQKLLDVISSRQVMQLRDAEEKFRRILIERLQQRRDQQQRDMNRDDLQKRRDEWQRRKSNGN